MYGSAKHGLLKIWPMLCEPPSVRLSKRARYGPVLAVHGPLDLQREQGYKLSVQNVPAFPEKESTCRNA